MNVVGFKIETRLRESLILKLSLLFSCPSSSRSTTDNSSETSYMADFHPLRSLHDEVEKDLEWDALNELATQLAATQPTAPLPSLEHLSYRDYEHVYEPSHDTFLLLDALQYEMDQLLRQRNAFQNRTDPVICLEIGCGSGVPSVFFRTQWLLLGQESRARPAPPLVSWVTDVNPRALQITLQTFQKAAHQHDEFPAMVQQAVQAVQCDLAAALLPRLQHQVTFILFNPPYVPTPDEEVGGTSIAASWAGGAQGRRVIDRAVPQLAQLLEEDDEPNAAAAYLVTVDDNRPAELAVLMAEHRLRMRPLFRRRSHNEFLTVQKITRMKTTDDASSNA